MAERRNDQQVHPLPQSYTYNTAFNVKRDQESASSDSDEIRRKKRLKYLAYFAAFVVFQTGIIVLFSLTIMKIRTPKFRVRSSAFETFDAGTTTNPSFNYRMNAELGVRNNNFGTYKFQNSTIYFSYNGTPIGETLVPNSKAGWLSTKKLNVVVDLSSNNLASNSQLGNDLSTGVLKLNAQSKLSGKDFVVSFPKLLGGFVTKIVLSVTFGLVLDVHVFGPALLDVEFAKVDYER
nr:late embryogenesis abundant protein At1g64065-like [Coffea arabica]